MLPPQMVVELMFSGIGGLILVWCAWRHDGLIPDDALGLLALLIGVAVL